VIGRELALAEAPEAHRVVLEPGAFGKIVLKSWNRIRVSRFRARRRRSNVQAAWGGSRFDR